MGREACFFTQGAVIRDPWKMPTTGAGLKGTVLVPQLGLLLSYRTR